jgi:hypothetical protein
MYPACRVNKKKQKNRRTPASDPSASSGQALTGLPIDVPEYYWSGYPGFGMQ